MSHCFHAFTLLKYFHDPSLLQHNVQLFACIWNKIGTSGEAAVSRIFCLYCPNSVFTVVCKYY